MSDPVIVEKYRAQEAVGMTPVTPEYPLYVAPLSEPPRTAQGRKG